VIVRKSSYEREVERLENELAFVRAEHDRQREVLIRDLRDALAEDITGRVRGETKEERDALMRHRDRFVRLLRACQTLLPEARREASIAVFSEEQVLAEIRAILRELQNESSPFLTGKLNPLDGSGFVQ
jgi:hypothetical protein